MDTKPAAGFRPGCLTWCLVILGIVLAVLAVGSAWYASHGDIVETRSWLRGRGLPSTWDEVGLRHADAARTADWQRLLALNTSLSAYESAGGPWVPTPGMAPPAALAAHLQAQPAADVEAFRELLDRIGDQPINRRIRATIDDDFDELGPLRRLVRWSTQRMAVAGSAAVADEALRAARLIPIREPALALTHLVSCSLAGIWLASVASRLPDLPPADRRILSACCRELAGRLRAQGESALLHEGLTFLVYAETMPFATLRQTLPSGNHVETGLIALALRAGRAELVRTTIGLHDAVVAAPDPPARLAASRAIQSRIAGLPITSPLRAAWMVMTAFDHVVQAECRTRQRLALLAAELDGLPWPADPEDPAGGAYRRFERDGRLIGAYSVGADGVDAHGGGDDRCIDLYGPCKPPKP